MVQMLCANMVPVRARMDCLENPRRLARNLDYVIPTHVAQILSVKLMVHVCARMDSLEIPGRLARNLKVITYTSIKNNIYTVDGRLFQMLSTQVLFSKGTLSILVESFLLKKLCRF